MSAYNVWIRGLSGAGFRVYNSSGNLAWVNEINSVEVDLTNLATTLVLAGERDNFVRTQAPGNPTVTLTNPAVFTLNAHGYSNGDIIQLSTTGTLPTGFTATTSLGDFANDYTNYYVVSATTNTFELSATYGGSGIAGTVSQSGTHTSTPVSTNVVGLTQYGFRVKNNAGTKVVVNINNGVTQVNLTDGNTRRLLRRSFGRYVVSNSATSCFIVGLQKAQNGFKVYNQTQATATLTGSNSANATNGKIVTIGSTTYTLDTALTEAYATDTLTTSGTPASVRATGTITVGTEPNNLDTVTVGGVTYTFLTTMSNAAPYNVLIGGSNTAAALNLQYAINNTGGTAGTNYSTGGAANPYVTASTTTDVCTVTAVTYNATLGNALTVATSASARITVPATLSSGTNYTVTIGNGTSTQVYTLVEALTTSSDGGAQAYEVLINGEDGSLTNLAEAINLTGTAGTTYGTGTAINPYVSSGAVVAHAITLTAKVLGTAPNGVYTLARVGADFTVGAATFSGGVNSVANQVVIAGTADLTLTSLADAINGASGAGSLYSTATVANTSATSSAVASHVLTLTAITGGLAGNSITFTTNEPTYTASAFTGGFTDQPTQIYMKPENLSGTGEVGDTVTLTNFYNFPQLRRHYRDWLEG